MIRSSILGLVLAVGSTTGQLPAGDQQTSPSQPQSVALEQTQPSLQTPPVDPLTIGPFKGLFQPRPSLPPDPNLAAALLAQQTEKKRVACGLTMWTVDPSTDPKIHLPLLPQAKPGQKPVLEKQHDFKVRRITPTICHE